MIIGILILIELWVIIFYPSVFVDVSLQAAIKPILDFIQKSCQVPSHFNDDRHEWYFVICIINICNYHF